ncbi:AhpC/TSA antioxidant enzyme-domain-containing protein [Desarmillaria tabescens]|uniref:AhpC/TSA antioxidant enzyme-domain-containing protein n=1 Tax=Armillaria tabescens TaxID=1929756 RepID=A0AA39K1L8_ARMTA|nr:AhpC/TSA antioxidant enzyme-domain-containing protein [Desarmillaria tabescens]KAK0452834.1 AhpC/TSA antioxidant enzyme-domain-containing protein [Desarmillaria tabescens]
MSLMNEIPKQSALAEAFELEILDGKGSTVNFGSLLPSDPPEKVVVVFIRHFFCGSCKQYVEELASVPQESLDKANARIIVIGCGHPDAIKFYKESAKFPGQIYADPTRKLYHALGMDIENLAMTPTGKERRSYLKVGAFYNAVSSTFQGPLKNPSLIGKQGKISQLGGDFVFGPECIFASRMQNTEDHVEVSELMKHADVDL